MIVAEYCGNGNTCFADIGRMIGRSGFAVRHKLTRLGLYTPEGKRQKKGKLKQQAEIEAISAAEAGNKLLKMRW